MLVSVGRGPLVENVGLEAAGVEFDKRKGITTDEHRRTNVEHIYAVGDCAGYWQLAHTAFREGEVAAENACGHDAIVDNRAVPRPIYTDPEIAGVGLTEAEAREQYGDDIAVGTFPWIANARAVMQAETTGWVKSIHETKYGELLGMVMVGPHVTDLIEAAVVAIDAESTVETVGDGMAAHPTLSEAIKEAALAALGRAIHIPNKKRAAGEGLDGARLNLARRCRRAGFGCNGTRERLRGLVRDRAHARAERHGEARHRRDDRGREQGARVAERPRDQREHDEAERHEDERDEDVVRAHTCEHAARDTALQVRLPVGVAERDRRHADRPRSGERGDRQRAGERGDRQPDERGGGEAERQRPARMQPHRREPADDRSERAAGRDDRPVAGAAEIVARDHRAEHDERGEAEVRDREADDRRAYPPARRHLPQSVAQLVRERVARQALVRGDPQLHQEPGAREEADRVDREDPARVR